MKETQKLAEKKAWSLFFRTRFLT